jgi:hypothetical protein
MTSINCTFIMTGDSQYLADHYSRDEELLIHSSPSQDRSNIIDEFWEGLAATSTRLYDEDFSDEQIKEAISLMVESLGDEDCWPSYLDEEPDDDGVVAIHAYLSWSPSREAQGFRAYYNGNHLCDNPHPHGSAEYAAWKLGWKEAEQKDSRDA